MNLGKEDAGVLGKKKEGKAMKTGQDKGPFCQSCGMPLQKPEDFGSGADGFRINDYCRFCFQNGSFTEPNISMQDMIDKCVGIMTQQAIMPENQARTLMTEMLPKLKRWQPE
jgi:hypothetical protein